jgi:1-deoxyxylulose-5-phosphate synthase
MQYRKMGRTGLKVSTYCLGTMTLGSQVSEKDSLQIIQTAIELGVNFFDTADMYVTGKSEEILGKAIKGKRDSLVLATKVGHWLKMKGIIRMEASPDAEGRPTPYSPWESGGEAGPNDMGLSRKHIMQGVEASLRRLDTDYIDLYYCHMPDYDTPLEETLRALDDLVHQGKVRYIGCSNYCAWRLCKALGVSAQHNLARFDCVQPPYNLLARDVEYELMPLCVDEGIGMCVYSPMAAGFLSGKYDKEKRAIEGARFSLGHLGLRYNKQYWADSNFEAVNQLKQLAEANGRNLAQFSLAWVLQHRAITSVVCGASSLSQLEQNLEATELKLTDEELKACDDVWSILRPFRFFYGR